MFCPPLVGFADTLRAVFKNGHQWKLGLRPQTTIGTDPFLKTVLGCVKGDLARASRTNTAQLYYLKAQNFRINAPYPPLAQASIAFHQWIRAGAV